MVMLELSISTEGCVVLRTLNSLSTPLQGTGETNKIMGGLPCDEDAYHTAWGGGGECGEGGILGEPEKTDAKDEAHYYTVPYFSF